MPQLKGPDVTKALFGGVFDIDGGGHFPGLELINFIVCGTSGLLPSPETEQIHLRRVSHEFARRLVADVLSAELRSKVLLDQHSEIAVAHLLRCLELEVPNSIKTRAKSWERTHFFPYTRSLVHWDAREARGSDREGKARLERRYYRGGGAFAFSVLRHDPDQNRLESIRKGFQKLYPMDTSSPLETLSAALQKHGAIDQVPVADTIEQSSLVLNDRWDDLYRDGMRNILSYETTLSVKRIQAVINWTGIWLVLLESARAAKYCDRNWTGIVVDSAASHPQLRRASQRCLKEHFVNIQDAANAYAESKDSQISGQQMNKIKGFFSSTAATCGLLNSNKGRRHFTLRLWAIEALVLACTAAQSEITFEDFVSEWLGRKCGLIIGREAASCTGLITSFDATIFEENERQFAEDMRATGMLRVYSDATRMVSPQVMQ